MAWWNRSFDAKDLPESLRDKSPEELLKMLNSYNEMEQAGLNEKKKREELEGKLSEFDQMKGRLAELEAQRQQSPPQDQQPSQPEVPQEPPSPWIDPSGFVRNEMKPLANVALVSGMMTAKMYFEQNLSQRDRKIYKKYEKEVEQGVNTFAPEARVMPQSWLNMFLFVKGSHEGDIRKAEEDNPDAFFSETPTRGAGPAPDEEVVDKLTKEEEEVCRVFHYDPKQYLETRKQAALKGGAKGMYSSFSVPRRSEGAQ